MSNRLAGKTALISAAAQGIGRACALAYAREGAIVLATDINQAGLETLRDEAKISIRTLDVTDPDTIVAAAADIGAVDVLLNIAGFVPQGDILECSEADWDFAFNINAKGMFRMTKAFLPAMIANGGGSIINMSSVASSVSGLPKRVAYGASKAAVIGLTKAVAADHIRQGIRCNAICPGTIQSPSLDDRINTFDDPVQARKDFIARQPLGRLGTAEEIAEGAVYLGSDAAKYTTGTTMIIDGGLSI
ncbi:MAG: SDR family oxidoreductase [Alphaproteobacteria bacterium]|jgi:2-keto-3-deoxy-L-fuconate dehydrogenase|nr:SDR family oxidoreductase [Alphaproteobacteria bacterium]